jgi:hypothetical protein
MKNALISPNEQVNYVSSWDGIYPDLTPVYSYAGERIAEVSQTAFPVAPPLYWIECDDNVTAEAYCYNGGIIQIPPDAPQPEPVQPEATGVQTL